MNIIQTAVSQPDEIKPDRQREFEIMLSDRSREIIRLFEELERKRHQQAEMDETKSRFDGRQLRDRHRLRQNGYNGSSAAPHFHNFSERLDWHREDIADATLSPDHSRPTL